jgi:hypothetical protein
MNALRHGVFSTKFLLSDENPRDFQALLDGLQASLHPVGALELALVEKVAVTMWRQRRLVHAESARLELSRLPKAIASEIRWKLDIQGVDEEDLSQTPDPAHVDWCRKVMGELDHLADSDEIPDPDVAPLIVEQLATDAGGEERVADFLLEHESLSEYLDDLHHYCHRMICKADNHPVILKTASQVKASKLVDMDSAPAFERYHTTLDNQIYKALKALRDAQAWRLSSLEGETREVVGNDDLVDTRAA